MLALNGFRGVVGKTTNNWETWCEAVVSRPPTTTQAAGLTGREGFASCFGVLSDQEYLAMVGVGPDRGGDRCIALPIAPNLLRRYLSHSIPYSHRILSKTL